MARDFKSPTTSLDITESDRDGMEDTAYSVRNLADYFPGIDTIKVGTQGPLTQAPFRSDNSHANNGLQVVPIRMNGLQTTIWKPCGMNGFKTIEKGGRGYHKAWGVTLPSRKAPPKGKPL